MWIIKCYQSEIRLKKKLFFLQIHKLGLKFGMYTNIADVTCMGYPGSRNYFKIDTKTFAEWDIDYLKVDGCFVSEDYLNIGI